MNELRSTGPGSSSGIFDWQLLKKQLTFSPRPFADEADDPASPDQEQTPGVAAPSDAELSEHERAALTDNERLLSEIEARIMNMKENSSFYDAHGKLRPDISPPSIDRKM
jgi:hypothetical protein